MASSKKTPSAAAKKQAKGKSIKTEKKLLPKAKKIALKKKASAPTKQKAKRKILKERPISTKCLFCETKTVPSYKNYEILSKFLSDRGRTSEPRLLSQAGLTA